ncbi:MAG: hypothetical protein WCP96_15270 [Methylococcaceae bacterium]
MPLFIGFGIKIIPLSLHFIPGRIAFSGWYRPIFLITTARKTHLSSITSRLIAKT